MESPYCSCRLTRVRSRCSEEDLVTTRTSSSTRSGRSESPGREIPARPLPKRVALSPEEEAEQAAKRAQKKEKKVRGTPQHGL